MKPYSKYTPLLFASLAGGVLHAQDPTESSFDARSRAQDVRIARLEADLENLGASRASPGSSGYEAGYDKGFYIRSTDMEEDPFALEINGRIQFRYVNFGPDENTFNNLGTAASGTPIRVSRREDFEIERARLEFRGTFADPRLHFYINIDGDTDGDHDLSFHDFWFNFELSKALDLYIGKAFVPGSREWLEGSTGTHMIDRSMATVFFAPERSVGVWAQGEPMDGFHYRAMLGDGFRSTDLNSKEINDKPMVAASLWWEPLGAFGKGYADIKSEDEVRLRIGSSVTYSQQSGFNSSGRQLAESNFLVLDDGTQLTALNVDHFDVTVLAADAALKYQGLSVHGEAYYRWIENIGMTGASPANFPFDSNRAYGGYVAAGYMLVRERLELVTRVSSIMGDFKDTSEYGVGLNYYIDGSHRKKASFDVTSIDGSPVSSSGPNYRVGDDGLLFRAQVQLAF